jgi:hypothetical protein
MNNEIEKLERMVAFYRRLLIMWCGESYVAGKEQEEERRSSEARVQELAASLKPKKEKP